MFKENHHNIFKSLSKLHIKDLLIYISDLMAPTEANQLYLNFLKVFIHLNNNAMHQLIIKVSKCFEINALKNKNNYRILWDWCISKPWKLWNHWDLWLRFWSNLFSHMLTTVEAKHINRYMENILRQIDCSSLYQVVIMERFTFYSSGD